MKNKNTIIMKKLLLPLAIAVVFSACNTKKEEDKRDMLFLSDTSALTNNTMSDTGAITQAAPEPAAPVAKTTTRPKKAAPVYRPEPQPPVATPTPQPTAPEPVNTGTEPTGTAGTGTVDNTTTIPDKKEGISKSAKGAIIGGVAGAAAGAILTKKGKGAVIGGVIGAAGGYILGRKKDKADGRIQ
jgi:hypothetical protein